MSYLIEHYSQNMRNFVQDKYDSVVHLFGGNDFFLDVYLNIIIFMTVYWSVGALFTFLDITRWPQFLYRYKVQDEKITITQILPIIPKVIFNQTVVTLLFSTIGYYLLQLRGLKPSPEIPTLMQIIKDWIVFLLFKEIAFYYTHRLLHDRRIYKYIHKRHHEWSAPIAISAFYCHPIEMFFSNMPPGFIGPALMQSHRLTVWLWVFWGALETLFSHCGYRFWLFFSPEFHDYHHENFNGNYGVNGLLDWVHGTDKMFRQSKAYGLKSIKHPDSNSKTKNFDKNNNMKRKNK